jgi:hypothetical protein
MNADERRRGPRYILALSARLWSPAGEELDLIATAHELSVKGFKVETRAELKGGQFVAFSLDMPDGVPLKGRARVAWAKGEAYAHWAGLSFQDLSWKDRRRIGRLLDPDTTDWERIASSAGQAAMTIVVTLAAYRILFERYEVRRTLAEIAPQAAAALLAAWALLNLLRRR